MKWFAIPVLPLLLLISPISSAFAGSIHLKSGEVIETLGTWENGDKVFGFVNGEIESYPKSEVKSWHDVTTIESKSKTNYSKFETVEEMIEDFHDYNLSNGTFKVLNNDPLHIQLSPMVVKGDTKKTILSEVNRTIVYGVYRSFIHTPIKSFRVTAIPMEIDIKSKKIVIYPVTEKLYMPLVIKHYC